MIRKVFSSLLIANLFFFLSGCQQHPIIQEFAKEISPRTYEEILETGIEPAIEKDYKFPISYQYENGCFAFAVNHILQYKFDKKIDLYEAEKIVKKPRKVLWDANYINKFLDEYDITMHWYKDSETFFNFLEEGEPLVIQYPYKVGEDIYIGHLVAAFSFDDEGVWAADSISGKNILVPYDLVFGKSGRYTRYGFATVWLDE
jgi:hypothetical protein